MSGSPKLRADRIDPGETLTLRYTIRSLEDWEYVLPPARMPTIFHSAKDLLVTFSLSLMEHLVKPEKHVEELFSVLRRGGTATIQLPNLQYVFKPHSTAIPLAEGVAVVDLQGDWLSLREHEGYNKICWPSSGT